MSSAIVKEINYPDNDTDLSDKFTINTQKQHLTTMLSIPGQKQNSNTDSAWLSPFDVDHSIFEPFH